MGIKHKNVDEFFWPPAGGAGYTIAAGATIDSIRAPFRGELEELRVYVGTANTAGGTTHIQAISIENGGKTGAGTQVLCAALETKNDAVIKAVGDYSSFGNGQLFEEGDAINCLAEESGTPGGTDAVVSIWVKLKRHGRG
jgi:hypothetical protein